MYNDGSVLNKVIGLMKNIFDVIVKNLVGCCVL